MKPILTSVMFIMLWATFALASHPNDPSTAKIEPTSDQLTSSPEALFRQHIPFIAEQFIGMPVQMGGRPYKTGSTDNSSLFYSIYTTAAQKSRLVYNSSYLPMNALLTHLHPICVDDVEAGDLIVLKTGLAAMIYKKDPSGRLYMIYASEKRAQVITFHTDNPVYQVFWLDQLKDFYRLEQDMLSPGR